MPPIHRWIRENQKHVIRLFTDYELVTLSLYLLFDPVLAKRITNIIKDIPFFPPKGLHPLEMTNALLKGKAPLCYEPLSYTFQNHQCIHHSIMSFF